jgi:hypothetical protein
MKNIIAAAISLAPLMAMLLAFQHTSLDVFALSDYQSGYRHVIMIGTPMAQSVLANQADTEQEAGIASDSQGRPCTFGPFHDQCHDRFLQNSVLHSRFSGSVQFFERTNTGYWSASDPGFLRDFQTYHLFLVGTYPSSEYIGAKLVNQNITVCLDFRTDYNDSSGAAVCRPIKETEIPLKNDSVIDTGFFLVPYSFNASNANICVQAGYHNLYSCERIQGFDPYSASYPKLFYDMREDIYDLARAYDYCIHNHPEDDLYWCIRQVT